MKKQRNSSFELLKTIAVILIIFSSSIPYGATYNGSYISYVDISNTSNSVTHIIYTFCRWFGQIGDTLFVVCSAWFLCDSYSVNIKKALKLLFATFTISVIGLIVSFVLMSPSNAEILKSIFPTTLRTNWFVGCYIMYYIIHAGINKSVYDLSTVNLGIVTLFMFLFYSVFSMVTNLYYFTDLAAFIMIHFCVKFMKKINFANLSIKGSCAVAIVSFLCVFTYVIGTNTLELTKNNLIFCKYYNPAIVIMCIAFLNIASKQIIHNKYINTYSSLSLYIYLIHSNYFWLTYGKYKIYDLLLINGFSHLQSSCIFVASYILITFVLSMLFKVIYERIFNKIV